MFLGQNAECEEAILREGREIMGFERTNAIYELDVRERTKERGRGTVRERE